MRKPLIGIVLDSVDPLQQKEASSWYAKIPWYAIRTVYTQSIENAGGVSILIPYEFDAIETYSEILDGLLISGGHCDINPKYYGESIEHPDVFIKPKRTEFEWKITEKMFEVNKPILGICGGMQLLNVIFGGSLHQHLSDDNPSINHIQLQDRTLPQHTVEVKPQTLLSKILQNSRTIDVNSVHHQGIKKLGKNLRCNALAQDGLIEGIELPNYPFCLGVQWHPEFHVSSADTSIFSSFVDACKKN